MKLNAEMDFYTQKIRKNKDKILKYKEDLFNSGQFKDFTIRFSWDVVRFCYGGSSGICELYEKYNCNDDHIQTLAIKGLKQENIL